MRANIGHRTGDLVKYSPRRPPVTLTSFQSRVLEYMEINGDGHGAVIGGNYYTETHVRLDVALAEQLYWIIGE